ncbi:MAG: asparagine synthetase B, partial [Bacteroidetes bacterium]|nr:asparagine synthetase B [Fibrella sp.]
MKHHLTFLLVILSLTSRAASILIPMDERQTNHLKAYGIAYKILRDGQDVEWLLNYRGGSFMVDYTPSAETECLVRGVSFERLTDGVAGSIRQQLTNPDLNMDVVKLQKAAKIIVYSPIKVSPSEFENTDAVLLVLKYAEIPFEVVYDEEILKGDLPRYDWLHLHHEDFTGQYGRNMQRQSAADIKA